MKSVAHLLEEVAEQPHEVLDTFLLALDPRRKAWVEAQVPFAAEWLLRKGLVQAVFEKPKNRGVRVRLEATELGRTVGELISVI